MARILTEEEREKEREYNRKYRASHPEKIKELRERNKATHAKSARKWARNNPDSIKRYQRNWRVDKACFDGAKQRAKKKNIPFNLTRAYVNSITPTHCPVLGIKLESGTGTLVDSCISIDRIIPELGYVENNIIIVSNRANRIRSDSSPTELRQIADFYEQLIASKV